MTPYEAIAWIAKQSPDKSCSMAVIDEQVALALAYVAALEALEHQQAQERSARHVHVWMRR